MRFGWMVGPLCLFFFVVFLLFLFFCFFKPSPKGPGQKIEMAVNQVKAYQIPAGAEDVMIDFAGKALLKRFAASKL